MKIGQHITPEWLTSEFRDMYKNINRITINQMLSMTTGQFLTVLLLGDGTTIYQDVFNRHSDQYFDSMYFGVSYYNKYIEEINEIRSK